MKVQLFVTCFVDALYPDVGEDTLELLERVGVEVEFLEAQTCCGQPAFNAGFRDEAKAIARRFIDLYAKTSEPIIAPSGSCATMVRHFYHELFHDEAQTLAKAEGVGKRVYELTQFLTEVLGITDVHASFEGAVTYHPTCHLLRGLNQRRGPQQLLSHVEGAEVRPLPSAEECCGFGGLFSVKMPAISSAMLQRKLDNIQRTGADVVACCDVSCMTHMNGGLVRRGDKARVVHLVQLLNQNVKNKE